MKWSCSTKKIGTILGLAALACSLSLTEGHAEESAILAARNSDELASQLHQPLSSVTLDITSNEADVPEDRFPEVNRQLESNLNRELCPVNYMWVAPGLCHNPLYTEDVALERYGWSRGPFLQPFSSASRFIADTAFIPYQIGLDPPREAKTTLGYYRPGSQAPYVKKRLPFSWKGTALQLGATVGAGALFQ